MRMSLKKLAFGLLLIIHSTSACTEFIVECQDENQSNIVGRTMEWPTETDFGWDINFLPKDTIDKATLSSHCDPEKALTWTSKHKVLGITTKAPIKGIENVYVDGQNDAGLSVSALYLLGYAHYYEHVPEHKCSNAIQHIQVINYIISTYSSVKEVKQSLDDDTFPFVYAGKLPVPGPNGQITDVVFPLHWSISDVSGDAIVLEYTKEGGRRVFINQVGVVTNSPTYDWHTTNLKNFLNIQGEEFEKMYTRNNIQYNLKPFGHGTGMLGLPGDFTPPSRFIRTATFLRMSKRPKTVKDGVIKAWHIINSVDIVKEMMTGATGWSIVKDLANDVMYFRGLTYLGIRKIELNKLSGNAKKITIEAPFEEGVEEVTGKMKEKTKSRKNEL